MRRLRGWMPKSDTALRPCFWILCAAFGLGILLGQLADVTRAALFVVFGVWCLLVFFENRAREKRGGWMLYLGVA